MDAPVYHLEKVVKAREEALEDFDGPLDLILHLLSKNKIAIKDIQISLILEQYLAWMDQRKSLNLEVASEFISMASHLVYIKSRMLLSVDDEEALSEMEQLIASLEAHQRQEDYLKIQAVLPELEERFQQGRDILTKPPEVLERRREYRYVHSGEDLRRAMSLLLERLGNRLPPAVTAFEGIVGREAYPVEEKIAQLLTRLIEAGVSRFRSLFRGSRSRSEVVATFLAVLELCKARRVALAGDQRECTVTCISQEETEVPADEY